MGYIDAHSHVWTPDTTAFPLSAEYTPADMAPPSFTADELLAQAQPNGVDRVVLIQMSFYGFDNSYMLSEIAHRPETFRGVAIVDHTRADLGDEMARLRERGVRGFRIYQCGEFGAQPLDEEYRGICGLAGELQMAICPLLDVELLPATARAAAAFPQTTFVVDHLGRIGCGRPIEAAHVAALCELAAFPNCNVKVSGLYALGKGTAPYDDLVPVVQRLHEAFGADRLLWATDCPYQLVHGTYESSLSFVRDRLPFVSDEGKEAMLWGTSERIFFGR